MAVRPYLPPNSLRDATWDYHRGGFYVGDVAFDFDPRYVYHFTCDLSKDPSLAGSGVARIGRDKITIKLAKPPLATAPTLISSGGFTANWTAEGSFTQYKFVLWIDYNTRQMHPNYAGIPVTGTSLAVVADVVDGMEYSLETMKDGKSISLPSNRVAIEEGITTTSYLEDYVAAAYTINNSQETSGTAWDMENGTDGTLTAPFTLQQPGLFASYADKSILFNGGYGLKTIASTDIADIDWGVTFVFRFNNKSGNKWIGGLMSNTSNSPYAILKSGSTNANDGFVQWNNNSGSVITGTGTHTSCLVTIPNAVDGQEHAIWFGVITISAAKHFIVLYRGALPGNHQRNKAGRYCHWRGGKLHHYPFCSRRGGAHHNRFAGECQCAVSWL
jgi:hypothetical protein